MSSAYIAAALSWRIRLALPDRICPGKARVDMTLYAFLYSSYNFETYLLMCMYTLGRGFKSSTEYMLCGCHGLCFQCKAPSK
jgi:hypothetical protein